MSAIYLRQWLSATQRANCATPDLFAGNRFTLFGIRRALTKLGAAPIIDLETLDAHELEQMRVEIATQLRRKQQLKENA